jgi:serine/threonine-protein kinase
LTALPAELKNYLVFEEIGSGGMGVVYRALQRGTKRVVALKLIQGARSLDARWRDRFRTEAEALARLQHPNIVQVYEVGVERGCPFLSLEYVEGGSLARRLKAHGPLAPAAAARLVGALSEAVEAAHRANVLHRDIKPGNILIAADGAPKLSDFGLAKQLDTSGDATGSGAIIGTLSYMPPEQADGRVKELDARADVYALGATLYECLTGRPPFQAGTSTAILVQVKCSYPIRPCKRRPGIHRDLEAVCLKCLEKDPAKRYGSAAELAADLGRWQRGEPTEARPLSPPRRLGRWVKKHPAVAAATAAVCLLVLAGPALPWHRLVGGVPAPQVGVRSPDPDRELRLIEARLAAGQPAELIGETGPPRWPGEWVSGEAALGPSEANDGTVGFQTMRHSMLQLLRDPQQERYRFSCELRHVWAQGGGVVGLFVGHDLAPGVNGEEAHRAVVVAFNDSSPPDPPVNNHGLVTCSDVLLVRRPQEQFHKSSINIGGLWFDPRRGQSGPWRRIVIDVSPERVTVRWRADAGSFSEVVTWAPAPGGGDTLPHWKFLARNYPDAGVTVPDWHPRRPLGVWAHNSTVSIRNCVVKPLPPRPTDQELRDGL